MGFCQGRAPAVFCPHRRVHHKASFRAALEADIAFVLDLVGEITEPESEPTATGIPAPDELRERD